MHVIFFSARKHFLEICLNVFWLSVIKFWGICVWFSVVLRWLPVAWVWRERPCARLDPATVRGNGQGWQVSGGTGTCWGWNKPGGPGRACRHGAAILGAQTVLVGGGTYFYLSITSLEYSLPFFKQNVPINGFSDFLIQGEKIILSLDRRTLTHFGPICILVMCAFWHNLLNLHFTSL